MPDWDAYRIWRTCARKKRYKHLGQARREAHKQRLREYLCQYCGNYHLTSKGVDRD
jgi:5-methylcytosine-specific restriction endonuclease McrA